MTIPEARRALRAHNKLYTPQLADGPWFKAERERLESLITVLEQEAQARRDAYYKMVADAQAAKQIRREEYNKVLAQAALNRIAKEKRAEERERKRIERDAAKQLR